MGNDDIRTCSNVKHDTEDFPINATMYPFNECFHGVKVKQIEQYHYEQRDQDENYHSLSLTFRICFYDC